MLRVIITVLGIGLFLLVGCTAKTNEQEPTSEEEANLPEEKLNEHSKLAIQKMEADLSKFHLVAGWWKEEKILFVEKVEGVYHVKTFDIWTGDVDTLFTEPNLIVDVLIHPTDNLFLLHTSEDNTAAIMKVVDELGEVRDEVTISSSEIEIEWNDQDSTLILVTAFYEDWNFDVFLYDRKKFEVEVTKIQDPFPKWYTGNEIITNQISEHSLDGGQIYVYNIETESEEFSGLKNVVYFDAHDEHLLVVEAADDHLAHYKIINREGLVQSSWKMPALSNYSEWFFPKPFWLSNTELLLPVTEKGGQLDELKDSFKLARIGSGEKEIVFEEGDMTSRIVCLATGEMCLTGYSLEKIIDVKEGEELTWLIFPS